MQTRFLVDPALANHIPHEFGSIENPFPKLWRDKSFINENFFAEIKKDGSRYLLHIDVVSTLLSKKISTVTNTYVDKTLNCPHLTRTLIPSQYHGTVLDGEIVHPMSEKSDATTSIMGCGPEKAVARQKQTGWVGYHVFDMPFYKGQDIRNRPLRERRELLKQLVKELQPFIPIVMLKGIVSEQAERLFKEVIAKGGEGIILKDMRSCYGQGWYKVKKVRTWDVVITGFDPPKQYSKKVGGQVSETAYYLKNLIGSIRFGMYKGGILKECGTVSGISEKLRRDMSANPNAYIGTVLEIKAQERTKTGKFRHARVVRQRSDKAAIQCIDKD